MTRKKIIDQIIGMKYDPELDSTIDKLRTEKYGTKVQGSISVVTSYIDENTFLFQLRQEHLQEIQKNLYRLNWVQGIKDSMIEGEQISLIWE